ncbi:hypothetical protein [Flavobacterium soyangense]|uniref:Outer membrane protein beta-barrel domain-containing protein n=1 Tax=Flavobacterium soyangense TaxID=2023265 RepID=A0A930U9E4_9FLAO|nr:hypothetical protein [Flavobacterium soyangense]MBF2709131.1 hypothetical protein [Flavobacterium soyangense]
MKLKKITFLFLSFMAYTNSFAQNNTSKIAEKKSTVRQLTIEPGIGIHTNFGTDLILSNQIQWNPNRYLSLASYTSFNINNPFQRDFNGIKTNYDYSINQKIGIGTTFYAKKSSHTFLLMAGVKYSSFKETIDDPNFNKVSASINSFSPDYGLMYSLKKGLGKYFFTYRMYVPLYPWPIKGSDSNYLDGNLNNITLEVGIGINIK